MRVFLDTNVLASGFATRGLCADLLRHVLAEHSLVTCEVVLADLRRVLRTRLRLPTRSVDDVESFLREHEVASEPEDDPPTTIVRDPEDARVLASAVNAGVDVLVTSDRDLLDVAGDVRLRVVSPRQFWGLLEQPGS